MQVTAKSGKDCVRCRQKMPQGTAARWSTLPNNQKGDMEHDPACPSPTPIQSPSPAPSDASSPPAFTSTDARRWLAFDFETAWEEGGRKHRVLTHASEPMRSSVSEAGSETERTAYLAGVRAAHLAAIDLKRSSERSEP